MPTFPAFQQKLSQLNNPFYRGAAETPMEFGMPMGGPSQNPMRRKRPQSGSGGGIPLIQDSAADGLPEASGTSSPAVSTGASKIKEAVASQVRYEDMAPRQEEIPGDPTFQAHSKHGFKDRLKAMLYGAQAAAAQQPGNQFASVGGLIGGLINPGGAERLAFDQIEMPRARKAQAATMARNDARQKSFQTELDSRMKVAKLNELNQPEYASMAGGEYPVLYNKRDPSQQVIPTGPDGKPMRPSSIINTESRTQSAEDIARERAIALAERDVAKKQADFEKARMKYEHDRELKEVEARHRRELEEYRQKQQNYRTGVTEGGRNKRASQAEGGRNSRFQKKLGAGSSGSTEEKKKPIAPPSQ